MTTANEVWTRDAVLISRRSDFSGANAEFKHHDAICVLVRHYQPLSGTIELEVAWCGAASVEIANRG